MGIRALTLSTHVAHLKRAFNNT